MTGIERLAEAVLEIDQDDRDPPRFQPIQGRRLTGQVHGAIVPQDGRAGTPCRRPGGVH
jgi:hypothetical protein